MKKLLLLLSVVASVNVFAGESPTDFPWRATIHNDMQSLMIILQNYPYSPDNKLFTLHE